MPATKANIGIAGQGNHLLQLLAESEQLELLRIAQRIQLEHHTVLAQPEQKVQHVYFPETCVISAVANFATGATAEMIAVGREGFVPVLTILGSDYPLATYIVQVPGNALRISRGALLSHMHRSPGVRKILDRYLSAFIGHTLQSVACNATHTVEQRCAKWLLTIRDRTRNDTFQLTHEYFGELLGVTRQHVSIVARAFQKAELIRYQRGVVTIVNGAALEEVACECYSTIARMYEEHVGAGPRPASVNRRG